MNTLNGKTYEMQYLTDEEAAVINAMRQGATVEATFYDSNVIAFSELVDEKTFDFQNVNYCSDAEKPFIAYAMQNAQYNPTVRITHIVKTKKAAD